MRVVDTSFGRRHIDESLVEDYCGCDGCQPMMAPVTSGQRQASPSSSPLFWQRTRYCPDNGSLVCHFSVGVEVAEVPDH
jgi:hypothetical protein